MKKSMQVGLAILILVTSLYACQPAPKQEIVVGKDGDILENVIAASPSAGREESLAPEEANKPEHTVVSLKQADTWQESVPAGKGEMTIDAEILVPEPDAIPVLRLSEKGITEEYAKRVADVLFHDAKNIAVEGIYSKDQLEEIMIEYKKRITDLEINGAPPDDDRPVEEQIAELEEQLGEYVQMYQNYDNTQVENAERTVDYAFYPMTYMDTEVKGFTYSVELKDGTIGNFEALTERPGEPDNLSFLRDAAGMTGTIEEAEETASALLEKLGIGSFSVSGKELDTDCARIEYSKAIDDVPFTEVQSSGGAGGGVMTEEEMESLQNDPFYNEPIYSERISISVDDKGICYFSWYQPWETETVENEDVQILSIEEAKETFRQQIQRNLSSLDKPDEITISSVVLGFRYSRIKNESGAVRAIPVYDFIGGTQDDRANGFSQSYLTINALDGSIFDVNQNY